MAFQDIINREVYMRFFKWLFRKNRVGIKNDISFKKRARSITALILALLLFVNLGRVGWIIGVHGDEYRSIAERNQLYDTTIKAVRGTIYDSNMTPLVTSSSAWIFCAAPSAINAKFENNPEHKELTKKLISYLSKNIAKILSLKRKDVSADLSDSEKNYVRISTKVNANERLALDEFLEKNYVYGYTDSGEEKTVAVRSFFSYENSSIRFYPENNFASTIIGVTDSDGNGISGVETYYDSVLSGKDGRQVTAKNSIGQSLDSSYESVFDATEGNGVVLTINSNIQYYLENALNNALESTKAKGVYGIVMDVDTGKVLAMSNKPDFDLNDPRTLVDKDAKKELKKYEGKKNYSEKLTEKLFAQWNSYCVTNTYEPGSTFKIFTAAAALEEGVVDLNSTYTCNGYYTVAGNTTIHCAKVEGHGYQTLTQGLMNSCNPFFIDIGQKLGIETFYKYFEAFGFLERTGIDLTGEAYPVNHLVEERGLVELASTSYGQSFRVSPIQMITAACAIANGGKLMKPYVVDSIVDTNGNIISKTEPTVKRQVVSEETAATVRNMMEAVVESGTGKNAYIEGYRVAGKTATSEKLDTKDPDDYIASFICFAPANDPQVAILVGVDEPAGEYRGGGVLAAPIAKEVMESTLKYLNVEPQYTKDELESISRTTPDLTGESLANARVAAANNGFSVRVVGSGTSVVSQVPSAGQSIPEGGVIVLYTEASDKAEFVKVPSFVGLSASQANQLAVSSGLNLVLSGPSQSAGAVVYSQSVEKNTELEAGASVTVYFRATANMDD